MDGAVLGMDGDGAARVAGAPIGRAGVAAACGSRSGGTLRPLRVRSHRRADVDLRGVRPRAPGRRPVAPPPPPTAAGRARTPPRDRAARVRRATAGARVRLGLLPPRGTGLLALARRGPVRCNERPVPYPHDT